MLPSLRLLLLASLAFLPVRLLALDPLPVTQIQSMQAASLAPLPDNGVVPLAVIAGDFASNQQEALGKYGGQRFTVIGRVAALSQGSSENRILMVTLQDPSAAQPAVKAQFLAGAIPENSEIEISSDGTMATILRRDRSGNILSRSSYLNVDQRVAIKGSFKGLKVGDIVLTDCKLEPKGKFQTR